MARTRERLTTEEAADYFQLLSDFNVVPIITWSTEGDIYSCNDAFLSLLGYTRHDWDSKMINWKDITPKEYLPLDEKCIQELKKNTIATPYEKEYIRKDGTRIRIRLYNGHFDTASKRGVGVIVPATYPKIKK